jgi:hypothetical protein
MACCPGVRSKELDVTRCGVLIGSAMGGMHSFAGAVEALETSGHRKMNPFCIPFAITNMGGALAAMDLGFMVRVCARALQHAHSHPHSQSYCAEALSRSRHAHCRAPTTASRPRARPVTSAYRTLRTTSARAMRT